MIAAIAAAVPALLAWPPAAAAEQGRIIYSNIRKFVSGCRSPSGRFSCCGSIS